MKKKLPPESFAFYLGLGVGRSYQAVAERYSVTKRTVYTRATKEKWQDRLAEEEKKARVQAEKRAAESIVTVNENHLKVLRFIQGKAIETLKNTPINNAMEAVKAYALAFDKERLIRGGPEDQAASRIEEITRQEIRTLLTTKPRDPDDPTDY
jgi:hypothetical protein